MAELVSIIVLSYNSCATIRDTLESCYAQSYPTFEVVVADDGSQDDSVAIAREIARMHPTVETVIVPNPINTGTVQNCRRSLEKASGTWVKFIAADDTLQPSCLLDLVAAGHHSDVVFSQFRSFGAESRLYPTAWTVHLMNRRNIARAMLMDFDAVAPGALIRLNVLRDEDLPSKRYLMAEDTLYLDLAKRGYRFKFLEKVTVNFRVHDQQITAGKVPASAAFAADRLRGLAETRRELGARHPFYWHILYQRLLDGTRLPRLLRASLKLIDPFHIVKSWVNRELPWQRRSAALATCATPGTSSADDRSSGGSRQGVVNKITSAQ
jgi:alpha-1,3-rhamnosyltransferase